MNQSFSDTPELTKLYHLSNFHGERCPELPNKHVVAHIIISLSIFLYRNIICKKNLRQNLCKRIA